MAQKETGSEQCSKLDGGFLEYVKLMLHKYKYYDAIFGVNDMVFISYGTQKCTLFLQT